MISLKRNSSSSALAVKEIDRLNKIDLEYMRAYTAKSAEGLRGLVDPALLDKINWMVHCFNTRYFADDKFRHTKWEVISRNGNICTLKKSVTYDKIRVNAAMSINAASNYAERWIINTLVKIVVVDIEEWSA